MRRALMAFALGCLMTAAPARAQFHAGVALRWSHSLFAATEYYSFTLRINHSKTVGTGACGGCSTPIYIMLAQVNVTTPTLADNRLLAGPLDGAVSDLVSWNALPVPVRASSWGAVKSLYR